jgi:hypothetical protein
MLLWVCNEDQQNTESSLAQSNIPVETELIWWSLLFHNFAPYLWNTTGIIPLNNITSNWFNLQG